MLEIIYYAIHHHLFVYRLLHALASEVKEPQNEVKPTSFK